MKKAVFGMLMLLMVTGCWDRMPLRDLHLVDIVGLDLDEKSGDFILDYVVTAFKKGSQGGGEPNTETTELRGPSLVEAVGKGEYSEQSPFSAINTRIFVMSESFASRDPIRSLAFLLRAPNTSINAPVIVYEESVSKLLKNKSSPGNAFTEKLNHFILSLETVGITSNVSMVHFILSIEDPLEDLALPLVKQSDSGLELGGALLFRQGKSTGSKLSPEQVRMVKLLLGDERGGQKLTGRLPERNEGSQPSEGRSNGIEYGFSVKRVRSKITVQPDSGGLLKVNIDVRTAINAFEIGGEVHKLKVDYVNQMEKELGEELEKKAAATIKTLQKANCDILGIGKEIKAFHPSIWKGLDWRKDYPQLTIEPHFTVQILNTDVE